jgi:hypothetical protein
LQPLAEVAADPCDVLELREQRVALQAAFSAHSERAAIEKIETTFFASLRMPKLRRG